jgi:hypothetical protein
MELDKEPGHLRLALVAAGAYPELPPQEQVKMGYQNDRALMFRKLRLFCVLFVLVQLIDCSRQSKLVNSNAPILKIAVMADGRITVDGSPANIESVRASLKQLGKRKGVVWYYREAGNTEPPPQSAEVIQAVIENRLPIRLSSRPDYSDAIGMDGRTIPK